MLFKVKNHCHWLLFRLFSKSWNKNGSVMLINKWQIYKRSSFQFGLSLLILPISNHFFRHKRVVGYQPVDRSLLVTVFQAVSQLFLLVCFIELTNNKAIVGHVTRDIKDRISSLGLCTLPTVKWSSPGKFLSRVVVLMECSWSITYNLSSLNWLSVAVSR